MSQIKTFPCIGRYSEKNISAALQWHSIVPQTETGDPDGKEKDNQQQGRKTEESLPAIDPG
jgi:hypothetical protein